MLLLLSCFFTSTATTHITPYRHTLSRHDALPIPLTQPSARYADAPPKGEIFVIVGQPGEAPPASAEDADAALLEAMERLPVSKAAGEVAKKLGLDRRALYDRALELKA